MCVLYVSFGSKVRPRTFVCVAMRSAVTAQPLVGCVIWSPNISLTYNIVAT